MSDRVGAAYFDFDRTTIDGDAGVSFGWELFHMRRQRVRDDRRGTIGWAARNVRHGLADFGLLTQVGLLRTANMTGLVKRSQTIRKAYQMMAGLGLEETRELARDYFDEVLRGRLLEEARAEMERHRSQGRRVIVVTTGMHLVVDPVKQYMPVDDVIACDLVTHQGRITGQVTGPLWGQEKATAVRAYAHKHDLSLPRSWAYSDHISDLSFLRLVGHPVVVNGDLRLRLHARRHKWERVQWTHRFDHQKASSNGAQ